MTSKSLRSFAGGLIVAAGLCGAVYFFGPGEVTGTSEKLSEDEMKDSLTSKGYVIHSEKEWEDQIAEAESIKKQMDEAKAAETEKEPKEKSFTAQSCVCLKVRQASMSGKTFKKQSH